MSLTDENPNQQGFRLKFCDAGSHRFNAARLLEIAIASKLDFY